MKIAVSAAIGHLGSAIVRALLEIKPEDNVIGLARTPQKASYLCVEVRPGDYNNSEQLE